jgi:hypothetical protein
MLRSLGFAGIEVGRGNGVDMIGITGGKPSGWTAQTGPLHWGLDYEARAQHWRAKNPMGGPRDVLLLGAMPVLRATLSEERRLFARGNHPGAVKPRAISFSRIERGLVMEKPRLRGVRVLPRRRPALFLLIGL